MQYWGFPKYILTSGCYNTNTFLLFKEGNLLAVWFYAWDEKIPLYFYYLWLYVHMCFWVVGYVHMYADTTKVRGVGQSGTGVRGGCKPFKWGCWELCFFYWARKCPMLTYLSSKKGGKFLNITIKWSDLNEETSIVINNILFVIDLPL